MSAAPPTKALPRVLVVDDDPGLLQNLIELFQEEGFEVIAASGGADAVSLAKARGPDLVVCDIGMPEVDGYAVLRAIREHPATASLPFIFLTARSEARELRQGMNQGADDYVTKPFEPDDLVQAARARLRRLRDHGARVEQALSQRSRLAAAGGADEAHAGAGVVVADPSMRRVYAELVPLAQSQLNVLILGETGAGKEVIARQIHERSPRRAGPFLPLNCAALSESLLEAELFGHEKGAFTGAAQARPGLFEIAHGGTVFLDEVGELPLSIQTKLLRVLEDRTILRVGGRQPRAVDVRFVAATNRDLKRAIAERTFREDLYYRLDGASITVPPLRERRADITPLCEVFVTRASIEHDRPLCREVSERALERLVAYDWPGNVRQLKNVVERAVVLCAGERVELEHLPPEIRDAAAPAPDARVPPPSERASEVAAPSVEEGASTLERERERLEHELALLARERVLEALRQSGGNQSAAAERLGVSRRTLVYRLTALGLTRPRKR